MTETTGAQAGAPPRWEWRAFDASLAALEARIGAAAHVLPHHSEELYLANGRSPHNAKIRDELLDVERIKRTASSGLELWEALPKHGFPLSAPTVAAFFSALDLTPPDLRRAAFSMEEFLADVIGRDPSFRIVRVVKSRRVFSFCGGRAELSRLSIGGAKHQSFCIEDESANRVEAVLRELALDPAANTNYPNFFKRLASLGA